MTAKSEGMWPAGAVTSPARQAEPERLLAQRLDVAHQGAYVWFCYEPHPHTRFVHQGRVEHVARPVPPHGVHPDEMPTLLRIERVWFALPAGTLVTIGAES